jgi:3-hydroxyacyl-CoA dehydrogenase
VGIGKRPILLHKEINGFVANRLQAALLREAFHLVEQGVCTFAELDQAVSSGPGFRWPFVGPFATVDFGGLDTWNRVCENIFPTLNNATTSPTVLQQLHYQGHLGIKTNQGIFSYNQENVRQSLQQRDHHLAQLLKLRE